MDQHESSTESKSSPARAQEGVPRWHIPVVSLALGGPVMSLLLWPAATWMLMESVYLAHYVSAFAAVCVVFAIAAHVLGRGHYAEAHGERGAASPKRAPRRIARRWVAAAGAAALAIGAEMAVHWAAADVHHHMAKALPGPNRLYVNHDVAKLVGETLGVMTLKARDDEKDPGARATLKAIAGVVPKEWLKLANAHDPRVVPLTEKELLCPEARGGRAGR